MSRLARGKRSSAIIFGLALLGSLLSSSALAQYAIDYVIDPYHPEILDSWLFDINNQGTTTGYVDRVLGGEYTKSAMKYGNGHIETLYSSTQFGGFATIAGLAINDAGDLVGLIDSEPHFFAANGTIAPIQVADSYVGVNFGLGSTGLNDAGDVLVTVYPFDLTAIPDAYAGIGIWNQGGLEMLSVLDELYPRVSPPDPNDFNSGPSSEHVSLSVTGLNGARQFAADIIKFAFDPGDPEDFEDDVFTESYISTYVYDGQGGYHLLETPSPGAKISPIDIEENGAVLGWIDDQQLGIWQADGSFALLLPDSGIALLRSGGFGSPTSQQNNLGEVVAITEVGGVLLFDPVLNAWTEITPSIAGLGGGTFSSIQAFNDWGQFVGLAYPPQNPSGSFGYVVSRVPEPAAYASLSLALLAATVAMWRRNGCR
jgi:hypothetical protein